MLAAAILWVVASPFLAGAAVGCRRPANRFVARPYWPSLCIGWLGVVALLVGVFVLDGMHGDAARVAGAPLAGLSFWSRGGGGEDGDDGPDEDAPPDSGFDWDEFTREFHEYTAAHDRRPAHV